MMIWLPSSGDRDYLRAELQREGCLPREEPGDLLSTHGLPPSGQLAFSRQCLPQAQAIQGASIKAWANHLLEAMLTQLGDDNPWQLHLWAAYGGQGAGAHRCSLIAASLRDTLKKRRKRRLPLERLAPDANAAIVQGLLLGPEHGLVSVAPLELFRQHPALISPWVDGWIEPAVDKSAPSRAFAKLSESLQRLHLPIQAGQRCVDLGAAPGSWTHVALTAGAWVTAVDRSELRADLMANPRLEFVAADAFAFSPKAQVDWLLCDVIAEPARSIALLLRWLQQRWMRAFVLTVKFRGDEEYGLLDELKAKAAPLCSDLRMQRLCSNKNEVCIFGIPVLQSKPTC